MRRYRDMFKATAEANAHFDRFFVGMGLQQVSATHIELRWRGQMGSRAVEVWLTNIGKWEVGSTHIRVVLPTTVEALVTVGGTVPPLKRVGMKGFGSLAPTLKTYAHDIEWGHSVFCTQPGVELLQRLDNLGCLQFEPGRIVWSDDIKPRDDAWVTGQLYLLAALAAASEQLPPGKPVPDSVIRRHAAAIAIAVGVLVTACIGGIIVAVIAATTSG